MIMFYMLLATHTALALTQDMYPSDDNWLGDLRRRNVVPLRHSNRRWYGINEEFENLGMNYRRTKNIRQDVIDRTFELTESQIREAQRAEDKEKLEDLDRELRWLTLETEEGIGI